MTCGPNQMILQAKFTYSALRKAFEEHTNTKKDKKKQTEALESL